MTSGFEILILCQTHSVQTIVVRKRTGKKRRLGWGGVGWGLCFALEVETAECLSPWSPLLPTAATACPPGGARRHKGTGGRAGGPQV